MAPNFEPCAFLTEICDPDMMLTTCIAQSSELAAISCRFIFSLKKEKRRLAVIGEFYLLEKQPET